MVSVVAAAIAALVAVLVYFLGQRQATVERKRRASAEAIADALSWLELPYRIRRRTSDTPETLGALAERVHHLQERLLFHDNWLRIEVPQAYPKYQELVRGVKEVALPFIREAWNTAPIDGASSMNVGDLGIRPDPELVEGFSDEVKKQLALWRIWS